MIVDPTDRTAASGLSMHDGELRLPVYCDETDRRMLAKGTVIVRFSRSLFGRPMPESIRLELPVDQGAMTRRECK